MEFNEYNIAGINEATIEELLKVEKAVNERLKLIKENNSKNSASTTREKARNIKWFKEVQFKIDERLKMLGYRELDEFDLSFMTEEEIKEWEQARKQYLESLEKETSEEIKEEKGESEMIKMKKATVNVLLKGYEKKEVAGYSFTYEGIEFNVHRKVDNDKYWNVTECKTGLLIVSGVWYKTRKSALEGLKRTFEKHGKEKIDQLIEKSLKKIENKMFFSGMKEKKEEVKKEIEKVYKEDIKKVIKEEVKETTVKNEEIKEEVKGKIVMDTEIIENDTINIASYECSTSFININRIVFPCIHQLEKDVKQLRKQLKENKVKLHKSNTLKILKDQKEEYKKMVKEYNSDFDKLVKGWKKKMEKGLFTGYGNDKEYLELRELTWKIQKIAQTTILNNIRSIESNVNEIKNELKYGCNYISLTL